MRHIETPGRCINDPQAGFVGAIGIMHMFFDDDGIMSIRTNVGYASGMNELPSFNRPLAHAGLLGSEIKHTMKVKD
jgi:hypothetical protein